MKEMRHGQAMGAVAYRLRAELLSRWRAWLGLAVVVGMAAGAVVTVAAGARRTESAYPRFLRAQRAYDVVLRNYPDDGTAVFDFEELARLPQVADAAGGSFGWVDLGPGTGAVATADGRIGTEINRFKLLQGRRAHPDRPEEVVVGFDAAERHGLQVGSKVRFVSPDILEDLRHLLAGDLDKVSPDMRDELEALPPEVLAAELSTLQKALRVMPDGAFRVVGIEASPGEFPPQFAGNYISVHATPAAHRLGVLGEGDNAVLFVRLNRGDADLPAFQAELERRADGKPFTTLVQAEHARAVQRSIGHQATALWILAALLAVTGVLVLGQTLARQTFLEAGGHSTLKALGMSRWQLFGLGVAQATLVGTLGAAVAVALAIAASPLFPRGLARLAEVAPGLRVDLPVLALGAAATVAVVALLAVVPAWRAASAPGVAVAADVRGGARPSGVVAAAARAGLPPVAVVGTRMALERGRGVAAVPVASSVLGVALGVAVLVGAVTFWASLEHLRDTPELYGLAWDVEAATVETWSGEEGEGDEGEAVEGEATGGRQAAVAALGAHPGVEAFGLGWAGDVGLHLEGRRVDTLVLDPVKGDIRPPVVEGRSPAAPEEIVVGIKTLRRLRLEVGDEVDARLAGVGSSHRLRVVGTAVLPTLSEGARLGEGAVGTMGLVALFDPAEADDPGAALFLKLAPGAEWEQVKADLEDQLGPLYVLPRGEPTDLVNFGRMESLPLAVGLILAALAAATLTHVLVTAVAQRRRDLAVLKTLGFTRRQVGVSVVWQATTLASVALVLGTPLGVAAGRWAWRAFAGQLGVVAEPVVPVLAVLATVAATVLLADLVAALPARAAARTPPALVLRTE